MSSIGNRDVFAKNLTFYLERADKSQREMAEIVGVSPSTFNDWTKGRKYPRIDKIEFLANYFGIKKSDLIEEKKNSPDERPLTEREKRMLAMFRKISEDRQESALAVLEVFLQMQKKP